MKDGQISGDDCIQLFCIFSYMQLIFLRLAPEGFKYSTLLKDLLPI